MAKKWTLSNAIKKYKPHLKDSLRKNKGNLNKRVLESLLKEMKQDYEEVWFKGVGRDRIIYTDKKRKEKAKKEDKRQFNKGIAPPHTKYLALMVMNRMESVDNKARTKNAWATYFGLISLAEQDIMKGIYSEKALKPYKEYMIRLGILQNGEDGVFQDLADTLTKVAKGQLQTALNQAEDMKLVRRVTSWKGKVKGTEEPIDIDKRIADEINFVQDELLNKHEISKRYSLMFKNSPKTKAFKADWLEYLESVDDEEGNVMQLQYIYEVFRIELLNKYAFKEYIKSHYPSEADSFNVLENEKLYHSRLLDYVVDYAQRKHDNFIKKKHYKSVQGKEDTKEIMMGLGLSKEEAVAYIEQLPEEETSANITEPSPYITLLEGEKYVDCIKKIFIQLCGMSPIGLEKIKKVQRINDKQQREELERLGLSNFADVKNERSAKKETHNRNASCVNTEQHEETSKKEQVKHRQLNQVAKQENIEQQGKMTVAKPSVESSTNYDEEDEYEAAMADIRDEIREYEEKYGDKAIQHMTLDAVIRELTRDVAAEDLIAEHKNKKQREMKDWEKLFEVSNPVNRELTTNNPLEVFQRIRNSRISKENS